MLAEILAYNESALYRSASPVFSFVLFHILSDVWPQHLFDERSGKENQSVIFTRCVDLCIQRVFPFYEFLYFSPTRQSYGHGRYKNRTEYYMRSNSD